MTITSDTKLTHELQSSFEVLDKDKLRKSIIERCARILFRSLARRDSFNSYRIRRRYVNVTFFSDEELSHLSHCIAIELENLRTSHDCERWVRIPTISHIAVQPDDTHLEIHPIIAKPTR